FVFNLPSQSEISQLPYLSLFNSFCIISFPISSITCRKYQTQDVRNASLKLISLFQSSFQKISPLHVLVEFSGSIIPFSKAISEEIILNVEHGGLLVSARS